MCCIICSCFWKLIEFLSSRELQMDKDFSKEYFGDRQKYKLLIGADRIEYCSYDKTDEVEVCSVDSSTSIIRSTTDDEEKAICTTVWKRLPAPMKNPQGVFIDNSLFVGGGFTMSSKTDAAIYAYSESSDSWVTLPPLSRALKSSSLTTIGKKLVLLGGKESQPKPGRVFKWEFSSTNRVASWDVETQSWESSLPSMIVPRVSPVVVRHDGYIIAAGGSKGSLDYRAELLDISSSPMHWVCSPNLPLPCYRNTSAVVGGMWYLLDSLKGDVLFIRLDTYVQQTLLLKGSMPSNIMSTSASGWRKLAHKPSSAAVPFKIANLGSHLVAFSDVNGKLSLHMLQEDGTWSTIGGQQLPPSLASALVLSRGAAEDDVLLVLGGENSVGFSDKTYKLSLKTQTELKENKRKQRVTLWSTMTPGTVCV